MRKCSNHPGSESRHLEIRYEMNYIRWRYLITWDFANISSAWKCVGKDSAAASGLNRKDWSLITDVCPGTAVGSGRTDGTVIVSRLLHIPPMQEVSLNLPAPSLPLALNELRYRKKGRNAFEEEIFSEY